MEVEKIKQLAEDFVSDLSTDALNITDYKKMNGVCDEDTIELRVKDIKIQFERYLKSFVTIAIQSGYEKGLHDGKIEGMKDLVFYVNTEIGELEFQKQQISVGNIKVFVEPEVLKTLNSFICTKN